METENHRWKITEGWRYFFARPYYDRGSLEDLIEDIVYCVGSDYYTITVISEEELMLVTTLFGRIVRLKKVPR